MAYIVSARKYRPRTFDQVVGQKAVTHILQKAIEQKRLPQALLFTGPRGVGKTSCARIMAREVNKAFLDDPDQDLSFNIFELDAASNNSVDDIRELINQVNIPPQVGKYKVYIIDEVHMLSNQAFNAFLKTLEEPPEHAIFILATTEKHKILPTILSRCQVFDFRRISVREIREHLREIADKEGIDIEDDALDLIARKADGALRDALSAFDKIVNVGEGKITRKQVSEYLGIPDRDEYATVTDLMLEGDRASLLRAFNTLVDSGTDIYHFVGGLASYLRDVMLMTDPRTYDILDYPQGIKDKLKEQAERTDAPSLMQAVEELQFVDLHYKTSQHPLLLTELGLLKAAEKLAKKKTPDLITSTPAANANPDPHPPSKAPAPQNSGPEPAIQTPPKETPKVPETPDEQKTPAGSASKSGEESQPGTSGEEEQALAGLAALKRLKKQNDRPKERKGFEAADVERYRKEYLDYLARNKEQNRYLTLKDIRLEVDGENIGLVFDSPLAVRSFKEFADEWMRFLQKKLHNHFLQFQIRVEERQVEKKPSYYTRQERLERLKELNPAFKTLMQLFKIRPE